MFFDYFVKLQKLETSISKFYASIKNLNKDKSNFNKPPLCNIKNYHWYYDIPIIYPPISKKFTATFCIP